MKKIIYLAPALLLGLVGKGVRADQNTHISHLDEDFMTSLSAPQLNQAVQNKEVKKSDSGQNQAAQNKSIAVNKTSEVNKTTATHISYLDNNNVVYNTKVAQYNTFNVKANVKTATNFIESKVTNSDQHTIRNPNNNQIIIHYVDEHGATIAGLKDYTIDIDNAPKGNSTGQFKVPDNRYVLPNPTSDYQLQHDKHNVHHAAVTHTVHHEAQGYYTTEEVPDGTYSTSEETTNGGSVVVDPSIEGQYIPDGATSDGSGGYVDGTLTYTPNYTEQQEWIQTSPAYDETVVDRPAYDETIGDNVFSDNSNNIKSVIGNTVNVILKHGTKNVDANNSDMELDSWRKVHVINSNNQSNLINESVKFKVGYTLDMVSLAKIANFNSSKALTNPNDFIGENKLTDPVGFSAINTKLLSISL